MDEVILQTSTSSEILEIELNSQPYKRRRLGIMGLVSQTRLVRWWFARYSRPLSESELSKIPVYPGA
jgi:hypothetical protein